MYLLYALKIIADVAFYFAFANFLATALFSVPEGVALYSIPVFALSGGLAFYLHVKTEGKLIRFLPLLLMAVNFIWIPVHIPGYIMLLFPTAYIIYITATSGKHPERFQYHIVFLWFLRIYIPIAVFTMMLSGIRDYMQFQSLPFAVIFFITSVAYMRLARHDDNVLNEWKFKVMNFVSIGLVFITGLVLGSRQLLDFVQQLFTAVFRGVFYPLLISLFNLLGRGINWLMGLFGEIELPPPSDMPEEDIEIAEEWLPMHEISPGENFHIALVVVVIVLTIAFMAWLINMLINSRTPHIAESGVLQRYSSLGKRATSERVRNPIRKVYLRFLRLCVRRGIPEQSYFTSRDYEKRATRLFTLNEEARALRELYLPIRYGRKTPAREDVTAAKDLYKKIRVKSKK